MENPHSAPYIAVNAGKPCLFERSRKPVRSTPKRWCEGLPPFVDRQGVKGILDERIKSDVVVLVSLSVE